MKDEKGYDQAIQNYAWKMAQISEMMPQSMKDAMPSAEDLENVSSQEEFDVFMDSIQATPEMEIEFGKMEEIANVISETYEVSLERVQTDTLGAGIKLAVAQAEAEFQGTLH